MALDDFVCHEKYLPLLEMVDIVKEMLSMNKIERVLFVLHLFVGIGAIGGGLAAILNPHEPLGMPVEALKNAPFTSYFVPGIILFTVIGLGNMAGAVALWSRWRLRGYTSSALGWALVIWIVVQCIMLQDVVFLHVLYFLLGVVKAALAMKVLLGILSIIVECKSRQRNGSR